jgi:16S rRNA G1207 methylase RsmC
MNTDYLTIGNIEVTVGTIHNEQGWGGGEIIYQEAVDLVKTLYPNHQFERCFEWCAGPGILGYSMLEFGVAKTLCLADYFEPSLRVARETMERFNLQDKVSIYNSNNLDSIPETEQWDLVIGNPPQFPGLIQLWGPNARDTRLYMDKDWELHKNFFANIKKFLKPNGKIFLWECAWGSAVDTFKPYIEAAGLKVSRFGNANNSNYMEIWYWIEIEYAD